MVIAKITWFNVSKGYGSLRDDSGKIYFVYGSLFGGDDLWGMNIPEHRIPKPGDLYQILKYEKPEKNNSFFNGIDFVVTKLQRCREYDAKIK